MPKDYVASFSAVQGTDVLHFGVRGMHWGIRNTDHGSSTSNVKRTGTGVKRGLVSDLTVSPYRSVGRIKSGKTTFNKLNPKQKNKLEKSLARAYAKASEKRLSKSTRGKINYLDQVQSNPNLRDYLIRGHGSLLKFGKRDKEITTKKRYLTTYSNYPRLLTVGSKTNLAVNTLGISALAGRVGSKHSDGVASNDYLGIIPDQSDDVEHFGVRGMHWGIRNNTRSSSGKPTPTRAKVKEDRARADTKKHSEINARIEKIKGGTGRPLVLNGKVLSRADSVKHLERQASKLAPKTKEASKTTEVKPDSAATTYSKLVAKAKEKGPSSLTDVELKYMNERGKALIAAKALIAKKDSWLVASIKNSMKTAINKQISTFAEAGVANFVGKVKASQEKAKTKKANKTARATAQGFPLRLSSKNPVVHKITTMP